MMNILDYSPVNRYNLISIFDNRYEKQSYDPRYHVYEQNDIKDVLHTNYSSYNKKDDLQQFIVFGKNFPKNINVPMIDSNELVYYAKIEKIIQLLISLNAHNFLYRLGYTEINDLYNFENSSLYFILYNNLAIKWYELVYGQNLNNIGLNRSQTKDFQSLSYALRFQSNLVDMSDLEASIGFMLVVCDNLMSIYPDEIETIQQYKNRLIIRKLTL